MINKSVPVANPLTGIPPFARLSQRFPEAGVGEVLGQATHPQGIVALVVFESGHSPPAILIATLLRGLSNGLSGVFHVQSRSGAACNHCDASAAPHHRTLPVLIGRVCFALKYSLNGEA